MSAPTAHEVADLVIEKLIAIGAVTPRPAAVLTLAEAMALTKKGCDESFYKWARKWASDASCGHGRYSRERIERGLEKEARARR